MGKCRIFHGTLGQEIPCNSHPACIRVGKWLHDHPADVRSAGQETEPSRRLTMAPNNVSVCLPFPSEARVWRAPQSETGGSPTPATSHICSGVDQTMSLWQRGGQGLAAVLVCPDMSGPGVPGLVGSVRTRLQRFAVRDHDRQKGRI